jgi:hypothetical protein
LKLCPILNALPVYLLARSCYDAELITMSSSSKQMMIFSKNNNNNNQYSSLSEEAKNENSNSNIINNSNNNNNNKRIIRSGDSFSGFYVVVKGTFRVYRHEHVAKFMQSREAAQAMREGGILDFDEGCLFGEEPIVNRRQTSTVDIDCVVVEKNTKKENLHQNQDEEATPPEWQVLRLDAKYCSTVLVPLLHTVLVMQAKTYGSEWYRVQNKKQDDQGEEQEPQAETKLEEEEKE